MVALDDLYVTANFKETQLKNIKPGQPVTITVDAYGREYKGKVERFAGASGAKFAQCPLELAILERMQRAMVRPRRVQVEIEARSDPPVNGRSPIRSVVQDYKILRHFVACLVPHEKFASVAERIHEFSITLRQRHV